MPGVLRPRFPALLSATCLAIVATAFDARAQDFPDRPRNDETERRPEDYPVHQRPNPWGAAAGTRIGSFLVLPSVTTGIFYDNNIFAAETARTGGWIWATAPKVVVRSDFSRHQLELDVGLSHRNYLDHGSETTTDGYGQVRGRVDVDSTTTVTAGGRVARLHEPRESLDVPFALAEPVPYDHYDANTTVNKVFNRLTVGLGARVQHFDYQDVPSITGLILDQDARDGTASTATSRVAYELSPGYHVFGRLDYNWRQFGDTPFARDSEGYRLLSGLEFEVGQLVKGSAGAGYLRQDFADPLSDDLSGFAYRVALEWNPTPLWTVLVSGERTISETTYLTAAGRAEATLGATVYYEFRRNLILNVGGLYAQHDYVGLPREDDILSGFVGLDYHLNRHLTVGVRHTIVDRDSNIPGLGFEKQVIGTYVTAKF